jgi:hypothetical protein
MLKRQDSLLDIGGISELLRCKSCNCIHNQPIKDDTSPVANVSTVFCEARLPTVIDGILVKSPLKSSQLLIIADAADNDNHESPMIFTVMRATSSRKNSFT